MSVNWYFVAMSVLLAFWAGLLICAELPPPILGRVRDTIGLFGIAALALALQLMLEAKR